MTALARRDYSLTGTESVRAGERGLANAEWFQADIDPATLRELTVRQNLRPGIDLAIWVALVIGSGALAWSQRGSGTKLQRRWQTEWNWDMRRTRTATWRFDNFGQEATCSRVQCP